MRAYRKTINGLHGSWGSGLATLCFQDGSSVYCDNGATVRAMDAAFGDVIAEGHCINSEALAGKEIIVILDDMGMNMLEGFCPVDDWDGPEVPLEGVEL